LVKGLFGLISTILFSTWIGIINCGLQFSNFIFANLIIFHIIILLS